MSLTNQIIKNFIHKNETQRLEFAKEQTKILSSYLYSCGLDNEEALSFYLNIIRLFVSADRKCGKQEYLMFKEILGVEVDYDNFFEFTNAGASESFVKEMDEIIDHLDGKIKYAICIIGLAILCSDGVIDESERQLFNRIVI